MAKKRTRQESAASSNSQTSRPTKQPRRYILSYLLPLDLLHLARTNKDFRGLLMSRSSISIWKSARRNVEGLPDCPPYLSEPAYAHLAFDAHCHGCLKPATYKVVWEFSARYCQKCFDDNITATWRFTSRDDFLTPLIKIHQSFYVHQHNEEKAVKLMESLKDETERRKFKEELIARSDMITQLSKPFNNWYEAVRSARRNEIATIRTARIESVLTKLRELGYGRYIDLLTPSQHCALIKLPPVCAPKPLTDRSWNSSKGPILELMDNHKADCLKKDRHHLLHSRLRVLKHARRQLAIGLNVEAYPSLRDFALFPEFRAIVDAPNEVVVNLSTFEPLRSSIPKLAEDWLAEKRNMFETIIRNSVDLGPNLDCSPFDLAMSYGLNCCKHRWCNGLYGSYETALDSDESTYVTLLGSDNVVIDKEVMKHIIRAYGQDPRRITMKEMDELPSRLTCVTCNPEGCLRIMTWRQAVMHRAQGGFRHRVIMVDKADIINAADVEERAIANAEDYDDIRKRSWRCAYCYTAHYNQTTDIQLEERVLSHLKTYDHYIKEEPLEGVDYYYSIRRRDLDNRRPVYLISESLKDTEVTKWCREVREALSNNEVKYCQIVTDVTVGQKP